MKQFSIRPFLEVMDLRVNAQALRQAAEERGYLYCPGLVKAGLVWGLRAKVAAVCHQLGWLAAGAPIKGIVRSGTRIDGYEDPSYLELVRKVMMMPEFEELGRHPAIIGILEILFGGPVEPGQGDVCRVFAPGSDELTTMPHQDHFYVGGATDLWTAWLPLGDCPLKLGGLAVLRGSNQRGLMSHTGQGVDKSICDIPEDTVWDGGDLRSGDVLLFNCLTVHRAGANRTLDRLRLSVDYRYHPRQV